jgi:hypothetical protein
MLEIGLGGLVAPWPRRNATIGVAWATRFEINDQ